MSSWLPAFLRPAAPPPPSSLLPTFLRRLAEPSVRTVLLAGCGGGFDFLHAMLLYPELKRLGKKIVISSHSFGDPGKIKGKAPTVFSEQKAVVRRVNASCVADPHYGPEVHLCSFLDERFPQEAPHHIDASYARSFTAPILGRYHRQLVAEHAVDAVVLFDGGSDSLMAGDEEGLGDPIEDAVSIAAVAGLAAPALKILVSVGLGADRFNHVSDAASLRAIAELTRLGGALGALVIEADSESARFYGDAVAHIYARQTFRSVLTATILGAIAGAFGADAPPPEAGHRVKAGDVYLWPLMSMLWAFDVNTVAARSQTVRWVASCDSMHGCYDAIVQGRNSLASGTRPVEELPRHVDFRNKGGRFF